jgi:hypothetical protein
MGRRSEQPERPVSVDPNLRPIGFPTTLDWSPANQQESLEKLYLFVVGECEASINWYYRKKGVKSLLGFLLRLGAILAVAVAGLIPLIGELLKRNLIRYQAPHPSGGARALRCSCRWPGGAFPSSLPGESVD